MNEEMDEMLNEAGSMVVEDPLNICAKQDQKQKHHVDGSEHNNTENPLGISCSTDFIKEEPELILEADETENIVRSKKHKLTRISTEQRTLMLDFMMKHTALATGRLTGPDGVERRQRLLQRLTTELNSLPNGASKTVDKWMKSWQDWRSDVKAKASLLKKEMQKSGAQLGTKAKPLTPLEQRLLDFLGPGVVSGHEEVPDPLSIACQTSSQTTQNDSDDEDTMEMGEYIIIPLEGSTITSTSDISSDNVSSAWTTPPLTSPEECVPSTSGFVPTSHKTESSCATTTAKKRKHSTNVGGTSAKDGDPLVDITRQQLICTQEQNAIRRAQLQLEERKTIAIETAAEAFAGAMKVLEEYLRCRRDKE